MAYEIGEPVSTNWDRLAEYNATPEFTAYWAAHEEFAALQHAYKLDKSPANFQTMENQRRVMNGLLDLCRALPIHKEVFGW